MLKDIKVPNPSVNTPKKVLTINETTANLLRRVAKLDGLQMTVFLDRCLRAYIEKYHTDWEIVQ